MSFRCFRLLDAICRQHYINKLCLWKVFRQSTEQWTFEKCKTPLERLGRAFKDCVEASFCGTVALYCTIVHYSALYRTVVASCCFMLLLVSARLRAQLPHRLLESRDHRFYHPGRRWPAGDRQVTGAQPSWQSSTSRRCVPWIDTWRWCSQEIGGKFVDPPTFDIAKSYADSALLLQKVLNQMKHGPKQQRQQSNMTCDETSWWSHDEVV